MDYNFYLKISWNDEPGEESVLAKCSYSELIKMLSLHWSECPGFHLNVRRKALEELVKSHSQPKLDNNPIKAGNELVVIGETIFKPKDLSERLEKFGVKVASKITNLTTHVLLGVNPKTTKGLENYSITLLRDQDLQAELDRLEKPYLKEQNKETQSSVEHIGNLLMSAQDENIELAIQIIEGGGFPKELLSHAFIAMKQTNNKTIRASLKVIMSKHLSSNAKRSIQRTLPFNKNMLETHLQKNLKKYTQGVPELNPLEIADLMLKHHKKCAQYLFAFVKDARRIHQVIDVFIEHKKLDFSDLGMSKLPKELESYAELEEVDLSFNELASIPAFLGKLKNVRYLNLMGNPIRATNAILLEMKNLRHLILRCPIYDWKNWARVTQLKQLEKLEVSSYTFYHQEIDILDILQKELPNCEIIVH